MRSIKRMLRPALRILCFGLTFLLLCSLCQLYLCRATEFDVALDTFYALPRDAVTTLFVGTSLPWDAYWADVFDEAMGEGFCYSLTSAGQSVAASRYVLEEAFKTQSPEVIVVDANWCVMSLMGDDQEPPTNTVSDLTIVDALKPSATKLSYILHDIPSENWVDVAFPFFRYRGEYDLRLMQVNFEKKVMLAGTEYTDRGFRHRAETCAADAVGWQDVYAWRGVMPERLAQLEQVIALCRAHGAEPLILVPPLSYAALAALPNYQDYLDVMERFAERQGVLFVDFSLTRAEKLARPGSGYYDACHLAGRSVSEPFTRLAAEVVRKARTGAFDRGEYLYASYAELMGALREVCAAWSRFDAQTRTATFGCYAPPQITPEYRYALKTEHAENYDAFTPYSEAASADLSHLPAGRYWLRLEARAVGSVSAYEQCDEQLIEVE